MCCRSEASTDGSSALLATMHQPAPCRRGEEAAGPSALGYPDHSVAHAPLASRSGTRSAAHAATPAPMFAARAYQPRRVDLPAHHGRDAARATTFMPTDGAHTVEPSLTGAPQATVSTHASAALAVHDAPDAAPAPASHSLPAPNVAEDDDDEPCPPGLELATTRSAGTGSGASALSQHRAVSKHLGPELAPDSKQRQHSTHLGMTTSNSSSFERTAAHEWRGSAPLPPVGCPRALRPPPTPLKRRAVAA